MSNLIQKMTRQDRMILGISWLITLIWVVVVRNHPFFWDNILNSRIAHFYLENDFSTLVIPESLDAGHPPFFSLYLAVGWKLLGKSLMVSHLLMLPVLLGTVFQFYKLARRYLPQNLRPWAMVLFFLEPTYLAQSSMMSADLVLVFGFLLSVNAVLDGKRIWQVIGLLLMAAMNVRGIYACGLVFGIETWINFKRYRQFRPGSIAAYLPAAVGTAIWLWVHHQATGWWLSPPPETYGAHRELVSIGGMARNVTLIGWRIADFGRIVLWGGLLLGWLLWILEEWDSDRKVRELLTLLIFPLFGFSLLFIPFSNPIGHRYYMVAFLIGSIFFLTFLEQITSGTRRIMIIGVTAIFLISGHFWVYPDEIAKGWDASLAHVPWFEVRGEMNAFVAAEGLDRAEILTDFPNIQPELYSDIAGSGKAYASREELEFSNAPYVIQSNVCNGFSDEELVDLKENWTEIRGFEKGQVYIRLYQNPKVHR